MSNNPLVMSPVLANIGINAIQSVGRATRPSLASKQMLNNAYNNYDMPDATERDDDLDADPSSDKETLEEELDYKVVKGKKRKIKVFATEAEAAEYKLKQKKKRFAYLRAELPESKILRSADVNAFLDTVKGKEFILFGESKSNKVAFKAEPGWKVNSNVQTLLKEQKHGYALFLYNDYKKVQKHVRQPVKDYEFSADHKELRITKPRGKKLTFKIYVH